MTPALWYQSKQSGQFPLERLRAADLLTSKELVIQSSLQERLVIQECAFLLFFLCWLVFKLRGPTGPVASPAHVFFDRSFTIWSSRGLVGFFL